MYKLIIAGLGVLAAALLAMGCGGGGSDEATAQVSKAEFYKQARAICGKAQRKLQAEYQALGSIEALYTKAAPLMEQEAEELEAITGPEKVEDKIKPMIANLRRASEVISQQGEKAVNDPTIATYKDEAAALNLSKC